MRKLHGWTAITIARLGGLAVPAAYVLIALQLVLGPVEIHREFRTAAA